MGVLKQEVYLNIAEFEKLTALTDESLEFIEGQVYALASPSINHQRVARRLTNIISNYLDEVNSHCELFFAPIDIKLTKKDLDSQIVVPDLVIICDPEGLNGVKYEGVPNLIIEILSPSNQHHDLVIKMNLYAKFGVKEYWIVNPIKKIISVYTLDTEQHYVQDDVVKLSGLIESKLYRGLTVDVEQLFK